MKQMVYENKKLTPGQLVHTGDRPPNEQLSSGTQRAFLPGKLRLHRRNHRPDGEEQDVYVLCIDHR